MNSHSQTIHKTNPLWKVSTDQHPMCVWLIPSWLLLPLFNFKSDFNIKQFWDAITMYMILMQYTTSEVFHKQPILLFILQTTPLTHTSIINTPIVVIMVIKSIYTFRMLYHPLDDNKENDNKVCDITPPNFLCMMKNIEHWIEAFTLISLSNSYELTSNYLNWKST